MKIDKKEPGVCFGRALDNPVMRKLNRLMKDITGADFVVLYPGDKGWSKTSYYSQDCRAGQFCRLMQTSREGSRHCRMCHVLMSVAACSLGKTMHTCHAGVTVFVQPIPCRGEEVSTVLSSCVLTASGGSVRRAWDNTRRRGKALGLDQKALKEAFDSLPHMSAQEIKLIHSILEIAADTACEIRQRMLVQGSASQGGSRQKTHVEIAVEDDLRHRYATAGLDQRQDDSAVRNARKQNILVNVVENLVRRRPELPYNVAEIASAARITPNHFSMVFRKSTGKTFISFLTDVRMKLAQKLLADFTLNITEIASRVGYDDPGYFARKFKLASGMSPREWREKLVNKS